VEGEEVSLHAVQHPAAEPWPLHARLSRHPRPLRLLEEVALTAAGKL
jgi:hypothetical protein